jgi:putative hydrolase of the HAD superfamily
VSFCDFSFILQFFGTLAHYSAGTEGKEFSKTTAWLVRRGFDGDQHLFREIWQRVFKMVNDEAVKTFDEFPMSRVVETFMAEAGVTTSQEETSEFIDIYLNDWNQGVSYISGLDSMIKRLSERYKLAVVSNTHFEPLVLNHLEKIGVLPFMQFVLTSIAFGKRKPHPSIFEESVTIAGVAKEEVLYIGDSHTDDYEGAFTAGIRCLLIDPEKRYPIKDADRISSILYLEGMLS